MIERTFQSGRKVLYGLMLDGAIQKLPIYLKIAKKNSAQKILAQKAET